MHHSKNWLPMTEMGQKETQRQLASFGNSRYLLGKEPPSRRVEKI